MKYEWKKQEKTLYGAKQTPTLITVPKQSYIMISGSGNPNPLYAEIRFDTMEDGKCIEILHIGPYDDEPASFEKMAQFAKNNGLERRESRHREIYLNNAGRVEKSKRKTILRYSVS